MGSQLSKKVHKSPKKNKNLFEFLKISKKYLYMGTSHPHQNSIKSKHINNPTTNQTQIHKYIQTYDTINKHKTKQHKQIFVKQNTEPTNTHKTKYTNQTR